MRKFFITLFAFAFLAAPAFARHEEGSVHDISVKVNGLVCDFCAQSLQKLFGKQEAVSAVYIDLGEGFIDIDLKDETSLDEETIRTIVTNAGFEVEAIEHAKKL